MSEEFIAQFVNSQIKTSGGSAEALDVTLGKKADAAVATVGTGSSLMAYAKGIFNHLLTYMSSTRMSKLDTIDTINTNINTIKTNTTQGGTSVVKSVQRGTTNIAWNNVDYNYRAVGITISAVAPEKCLVILNGGITQTLPSSTTATGCEAYIISLTTAALTISARSPHSSSTTISTSINTSWQIVEYY